MFRKRSAIMFLMIAYAITLGHSIIPHHHHDSNHHLNEPYQTSHHHHHDGDEEENKGISHLFSHFVHAADGFTFITQQNLSTVFFLVIALLPNNFSFDQFFIPPLILIPSTENFNYAFLNACTFGLRAPPAYIVS